MAVAEQMPGGDSVDNLIFYRPAAVAAKASGDKAKAKIDSVITFGEWLKKNYPDVYNAVMQARPDLFIPEFAMSGLGAADTTTAQPTTDWGTTIQSVIDKIISPMVGVYQQKQLIDLNIKRAESGLPPVDTSLVAPTVNISLPPAQQQQIADMGKYLGVGILAVGALVLLSRRRRR